MKSAAGKRIFFVGIGFYDYEDAIVSRLRELGARVDAFPDRPAILRNNILAGCLRRLGCHASAVMRWYERLLLRVALDVPYDYVLIIKGLAMSPEFFCALRRQQRRAIFILYQWDSMARMPGIEDRMPYFDRILSFDRKDAVDIPGVIFRPLFFRDDVGAADVSQVADAKIDLCFVGWLHSDRLSLVRRMQALARRQGLSMFTYLYSGWFTWLKLLVRRDAADVHVRAMPYKKLMAINQRASVILDFPHAMQTGLTMRAIEAIGSRKKLITTARDIKNYDFFFYDGVRIIQSERLTIDRSFVVDEQRSLPDEIRDRYSLDNWLADVFLFECVDVPR